MSDAYHTPIATGRTAAGLPTARLGTWWVVASEVVIFGGLIAAFVMYRLRHGDLWAAQAQHTNVWAGALNTFVLLTSSYFAVCAHQAASEGDGKKAAGLLYRTILLGGVFLCVKFYEYTSKLLPEWYHTPADHDPITMTTDLFWSFYYTATGLHGFHVLAGMVILWFVARDAARGNNLHRVECIGIYWHFVDVVWIFLFPLFYIASGL